MKRAMWAMGILTSALATAGCSGAQQNAATTTPAPTSAGTDASATAAPRTATAGAVEQQRIAGTMMIVPPDDVVDQIGRERNAKVTGIFKVCIDRAGAVQSAKTLKATGYPGYDAKLTSTIEATWKYRPFLFEGKPAPVCTAVTFIYATDFPPAAPPPVSPDYGKPVLPKDLESHRIAGVKWIQPSDPVVTTMSKAKERKFSGSYFVCVDETGNVAGINLVKSTTFPEYDQTIINTIGATWKYSPFLIDGVASRVCTKVTFIYSL